MQLSAKLNIQNNRSGVSVLLVCRERELISNLRHVLAGLGFANVSVSHNHILGLDRLLSGSFDLVLFEAKPSNMPSDQFVKQAMKVSPSSLFVALSHDPSIDDVFTMLRFGARGVLRLPMSLAQVEAVLVGAATAPPLSRAILEAVDRNKALSVMVLNCLYRLAESTRFLREYPSAIAEVNRNRMSLSDSMQLARTFAEGGDDALLDKLCEECCFRASLPSTRLGRTRLKLRKKRRTAAVQFG